jgi:hypothetical protein
LRYAWSNIALAEIDPASTGTITLPDVTRLANASL